MVYPLLGFLIQAAGQAPAAPARLERYAVVCQSREAAQAGAAVIEGGGNAVDAAVAAAFALAVTYPAAGNIGGGGFLVIHLPGGEPEARWRAIDFRERAPARAHPRMFLGPDGKYDPERHHRGHLSVGVPGTVAGLGLAHARHGRLPWKAVLAPAVRLAREGFPISAGLAASLAEVSPDLEPKPDAAAPFRRDGRPLRAGEVLVQAELAATLERIGAQGAEEFYRGRTAELLAAEMGRGGGWITRADLEAYRAVEREPVSGAYRDYRIITIGPPSSGGVALIEMLNILEGFDLAGAGGGSAAAIHWMAEAMRRAFADRARHLADPDQVEIPVERLISRDHAAALRAGIGARRASRSSPESFEWPPEGGETTHLSVIGPDGMAVALTTTLEQSYGAKIIVPGAGFLLNNEMGDFNPGPGLTDAAGLIGTEPNLAAPGKRMLSSMTPAILARGDEVVAVLGSPGGRTIPNSILGVVLYLVDHRLNIQEAVDAPRIHHQWLPDILYLERGFSPDTVRLLEERGHRVETRRNPQGSVMAIARDPDTGRLEVGCDRRLPDGAWAGK